MWDTLKAIPIWTILLQALVALVNPFEWFGSGWASVNFITGSVTIPAIDLTELFRSRVKNIDFSRLSISRIKFSFGILGGLSLFVHLEGLHIDCNLTKTEDSSGSKKESKTNANSISNILKLMSRFPFVSLKLSNILVSCRIETDQLLNNTAQFSLSTLSVQLNPRVDMNLRTLVNDIEISLSASSGISEINFSDPTIPVLFCPTFLVDMAVPSSLIAITVNVTIDDIVLNADSSNLQRLIDFMYVVNKRSWPSHESIVSMFDSSFSRLLEKFNECPEFDENVSSGNNVYRSSVMENTNNSNPMNEIKIKSRLIVKKFGLYNPSNLSTSAMSIPIIVVHNLCGDFNRNSDTDTHANTDEIHLTLRGIETAASVYDANTPELLVLSLVLTSPLSLGNSTGSNGQRICPHAALEYESTET